MQILDFDDLCSWNSIITTIAENIFSKEEINFVSNFEAEFIEDAAEQFALMRSYADITNILIEELSGYCVRFFHGTRLTTNDAASIQTLGLMPLATADRLVRLNAIFSKHERWSQVGGQLETILEELGPKQSAGKREDGCVHACLSRTGLLLGCNHYIEFGAEVDQHAAYRLFGDESGYQLLKNERSPAVIQLVKPFCEAISAMNPTSLPTDSFSSLPGTFFTSWSFRLSDNSYEPRQLKTSAAARFKGTIPASQIEKFEWISDSDLKAEL